MRFNFYKSNEKKLIGYWFLVVGIVVIMGFGLVILIFFLVNLKF